jgi:hypothetical protein
MRIVLPGKRGDQMNDKIDSIVSQDCGTTGAGLVPASVTRLAVRVQQRLDRERSVAGSGSVVHPASLIDD